MDSKNIIVPTYIKGLDPQELQEVGRLLDCQQDLFLYTSLYVLKARPVVANKKAIGVSLLYVNGVEQSELLRDKYKQQVMTTLDKGLKRDIQTSGGTYIALVYVTDDGLFIYDNYLYKLITPLQ